MIAFGEEQLLALIQLYKNFFVLTASWDGSVRSTQNSAGWGEQTIHTLDGILLGLISSTVFKRKKTGFPLNSWKKSAYNLHETASCFCSLSAEVFTFSSIVRQFCATNQTASSV